MLFVFREPNRRGKPYDLNMPAMVRHSEFGHFRDGVWKTGPTWWDKKVPAFGHAVVHALAGDRQSYPQFQALIGRGRKELEELRHKRTTGVRVSVCLHQHQDNWGTGHADTAAIKRHAKDYHQCLCDQVKLYKPHLIIACRRGSVSLARLRHKYVVLGGAEQRTVCLCLSRRMNSNGGGSPVRIDLFDVGVLSSVFSWLA
jgi:hypothetical protein